MPKFDNPLNNISVASSCRAEWNQMYGDERKRFCGDCKLNVYNLSGMSRDEAESLIINAEGRLCVRFYRRSDGSVITQDCPVGWAKVKGKMRVFAAAAASLLMALLTGVLFASMFSRPQRHREEVGVLVQLPTPIPEYGPMMGNIAVPTPQPKKVRKVGETDGLVQLRRGDG